MNVGTFKRWLIEHEVPDHAELTVQGETSYGTPWPIGLDNPNLDELDNPVLRDHAYGNYAKPTHVAIVEFQKDEVA